MLWRGPWRGEELLCLEKLSLRKLSVERKVGIFPVKVEKVDFRLSLCRGMK